MIYYTYKNSQKKTSVVCTQPTNDLAHQLLLMQYTRSCHPRHIPAALIAIIKHILHHTCIPPICCLIHLIHDTTRMVCGLSHRPIPSTCSGLSHHHHPLHATDASQDCLADCSHHHSHCCCYHHCRIHCHATVRHTFSHPTQQSAVAPSPGSC